jgi:hypothetical protein
MVGEATSEGQYHEISPVNYVRSQAARVCGRELHSAQFLQLNEDRVLASFLALYVSTVLT